MVDPDKQTQWYGFGWRRYVAIEQRIRKLRKERGWSQKVLAERLGTSEDVIQSWESGRRRPDSISQRLLARTFGLTRAQLTGDSVDGRPPP